MEKTPRTGPMAPDDTTLDKRDKTQPFVKESVKESLRNMPKKSVAPPGKRIRARTPDAVLEGAVTKDKPAQTRTVPVGLRDMEITEEEEEYVRAMVEHPTAVLAVSPYDLPGIDAATLLQRLRRAR